MYDFIVLNSVENQLLVLYSHRTPDQYVAVAPLLLLALLGSWLAMDGMFLYLSTIQIGMYAILALSSACIVGLSLHHMVISSRHVMFIAIWLLVSSAYLIPPLLADYPYPRYVLGDFIASVLPLLLLLLGFRYPKFFLSEKTYQFLGAMMLAAAVLAVPLSEVEARHEPPSTLLLALAWTTFFFSGNRTIRVFAAATLSLLLILTITSGERTAVVMWLGFGIAGKIFAAANLRGVGLTVILVAIAAFGLLQFFWETLLLAAANTRLEMLSHGELDTSLLNRVLEVRDVWSQWSWDRWLGFGHGATFVPDLSNPIRNLTSDGRVHHIHFGPMLVLFRYGVPGLCLFGWLVVDLIRYVMTMRRIAFRQPSGGISFLISLALTGYLASFLVFNIMPDPAFSFVLAGYIYFRLTFARPIRFEYETNRAIR